MKKLDNDTKEWLIILRAVLGFSALAILWWQTNGWIALALFLFLWAENIKRLIGENEKTR